MGLRTIAIIALAFLGVQVLRRLLRSGPPKEDPLQSARTIDGADMVQDPVCGVYTPRASAVQAEIAGESRYFCSERCKSAFLTGSSAEN